MAQCLLSPALSSNCRWKRGRRGRVLRREWGVVFVSALTKKVRARRPDMMSG